LNPALLSAAPVARVSTARRPTTLQRHLGHFLPALTDATLETEAAVDPQPPLHGV
jgi:hypothetical protein